MKCRHSSRGCSFSNAKLEVITSHEERCRYRPSSPTRHCHKPKSTIQRRELTEKEKTALLEKQRRNLLADMSRHKARKRPAEEALTSPALKQTTRRQTVEPDVVIINRKDNSILYHGYKAVRNRPATRDAQTQTPAATPSPSQPPAPATTSTPSKLDAIKMILAWAPFHNGLQSFVDDFQLHKQGDKSDPLLPSPSPSTDPLRLSTMPSLEVNSSFEAECRNPYATATIMDS